MAAIPKELFARIKRIEIETSRLAEELLVGLYRSAFKGRGMEFEEVREYIEGDDLRSIDWNVTARMNHPYVKNFREERELTVLLVVDISASSRFGSGERTKGELMAEIAALLSFTAVKNNDRVGLLLFSDGVELYLPPKRGLRHVLCAIRELLFYKPKGLGSDLKAAVDFLGKVQKRSALCFVLSDFLYTLPEKELSLTAKRHDLIALHVVDPLEEEFPPMGLVAMRDLETGKVAVVDTSRGELREKLRRKMREKERSLKALMGKIGAGYVTIKSDEPYQHPLRRFFHGRRVSH